MKHHNALFLSLTLVALGLLGTTGAAAQGLRLSPSMSAPGTSLQPPAGAAAAMAPTVQQADYIVAVVNSEPITNSEVNMRADRAAQQISQQGAALPPRDVLLRQVLSRLINEKAQLQQAVENGIKIDEPIIDQAEENVARQNNTDLAGLHRRMAADGISLERFRFDLRNQLMLLRLREREVESRVRVTDQDIDQFIREQQTAESATGQQINLQHVLVLVPENATPQQVASLQARSQGIADRAKGGADFAVLARENSDAPEGRSGGLLGLRPADRYPNLFVEATQNLPVGGIVGPVRSPAGFHILKVVERVNGTGVPTQVIQNHARHILLRPTPQMTEAAAIERLADLKRRVTTGQSDFGELAKQFSVDGSAKQGGDLGWANPGQFVPEFEEAIEGLQPGQVSDPLVSRFGVHIIQLIERREHTLNQREQRDMVRAAAREKKLDEAYTTWAQEVRGRAYVELREVPQ
ncbi:peptidylprolyl isomerase [Xylophilus sp. GOD-11R]|uniref:peptidylprolyl isomerase n=1 Tax=Xylophilus sp. GOD-11R TaxID=3089814 RepID=UPI00298C8ACC|nr:peptidylprolyl isomerase [Xylophilus sp. GOD-11R]WPB57063.1 peptidylprolyl isomerase [Xylophilus sp. GOD-11R]